MPHACACQSTVRCLALLYPERPDETVNLHAAAVRMGWSHNPELRVYALNVGPSLRFAGMGELSDFLRGIVPTAFDEIRAAWLDCGRAVEDQLPQLVRSQRLARIAGPPTSVLIDLLERRALETWFQPILSRSLQPWGYECLVRARDTAGDVLGPEQLIQWARQENLLFTLDRVCRELHVEHAAASGAEDDAHFFINFLPTVIYDPEVCLGSTIEAVKRVGLSPQRIVFEVVETEWVPDRRHLRRILDYYRGAGFRVAIDDLGAGQSDLVLLGDLAPDIIKIERELIEKGVTSSIHRSICRSVAAIGRSEGKLVLAEGVATEAEWDLVKSFDVDLVQGYLFGGPKPPPIRAGSTNA